MFRAIHDLRALSARLGIAVLAVLGTCLPASEVINGNPLSITVAPDMQVQVTRLQTSGSVTTPVNQYYDTYAPFLVLTGASTSTVYSPVGGSGAVQFTQYASSRPDAWTVVNTAVAGNGVGVEQRVTYVDGTQTYRHTWTITNAGNTTYTDASFRYGGDTLFSGSDEASGFHSAALGMVYCTNSGFPGFMGLVGGQGSPATHYIEGPYSPVWGWLATPPHLLDQADPDFLDNGMGLEWVHGAFAPGDVWTIVADEVWTDTDSIKVVAPQAQAAGVGAQVSVAFTVQNLHQGADTVTFALNPSLGLSAATPAQVTIPGGGSASVTILVTIGAAAAGGDATLALLATSSTDGIVTQASAVFHVPDSTEPVLSPVVVPPIQVSGRGRTVFGPICPSTPEGAARLLATMGRQSDSVAVAYAWDAARQGYAKLPDEPSGGLSASSGVFLATRVDLGLDFSGTPTFTPADLALLPGWNFIGVPLLDDDGPLLASHVFATDFELRDGSDALISDPAQIADTLGTVGSGDPLTARPWLYDGRTYGQVDTLETGRGYWIKNNTADAVTLRRVSSAVQAGIVLQATRHAARAAVYQDRGAPPSAPTAASADSGDGGGCGGGSGIACLLIGLGAFALRRRAA